MDPPVLIAKYAVGGMTCASCASAIERHLHTLPGVVNANVNLLLNEATVRFDEAKITPTSVAQQIELIGFEVELASTNKQAEAKPIRSSTLLVDPPTEVIIRDLVRSLTVIPAVQHVAQVSTSPGLIKVVHVPSELPVGQLLAIAKAYTRATVRLAENELPADQPQGVPAVAARSGQQGRPIGLLRVSAAPVGELKAAAGLRNLAKTFKMDGLLYITLSSVDGSKSNRTDSMIVTYDLSYNFEQIGARALLQALKEKVHSIAPAAELHVLSEPPSLNANQDEEFRKLLRNACWCIVPGLIIMWLAMSPHHDLPQFMRKSIIPGLSVCALVMAILATPIQLVWGREIHRKAWKALRSRHITMETFISFNTFFCYIFSLLLMLVTVVVAMASLSSGVPKDLSPARYAFPPHTGILPPVLMPLPEDLLRNDYDLPHLHSHTGGLPLPLTNPDHMRADQPNAFIVPLGLAPPNDRLQQSATRRMPQWPAQQNDPVMNDVAQLPFEERAGMSSPSNPSFIPQGLPDSKLNGANEGFPEIRAHQQLRSPPVLAAASRMELPPRRVLQMVGMTDVPPTHGGHLDVPHYFETSALLITVVLWGKVFELAAKGKTLKELKRLNQTKANDATLVRRVMLEGRNVPLHEDAPTLRGDRNFQSHWCQSADSNLAQLMWLITQRLQKSGKWPAVAGKPSLRLTVSPETSLITEFDEGVPTMKADLELVTFGSSLIEIGDILRVEPGQQIPADGVIITPTVGTVDESLISGESLPVTKRDGDLVFEGSIVYSEPIWMMVTRVGQATLLGQVIQTVREASAVVTPSGALADKICSFFLPTAFMLAVITWGIWSWLVFGGYVDPESSGKAHVHNHPSYLATATKLMFIMKFGISVLAVACPCALGLATPTATTVASGKAVNFGVLVKSGGALEAAASAGAIILDKTGTLTRGKPTVTGAYLHANHMIELFGDKAAAILPQYDNTQGTYQDQNLMVDSQQSAWDRVTTQALWKAFWAVVATLETGNKHPVAIALLQFVRKADFPFTPDDRTMHKIGVQDIQVVGGKGVVGKLGSEGIVLGNLSFYRSVVGEESDCFAEGDGRKWLAESEGSTIVCLFTENGLLLGAVRLKDEVLAEAAEAVRILQHDFDLSVWMCTGDNASVAHQVAQKVGIPPKQVVAEATPWMKHDLIERLWDIEAEQFHQGRQNHRRKIIMVGDGSNDSLALAKADVGIAIGTDAEIMAVAADVVLIKHDLNSLLSFMKLSKATRNTIFRNFIWAFLFNMIGLPMAAGAFYPHIEMSPLLAGTAMAGSSLLVILNSLLLFKVKAVHMKSTGPPAAPSLMRRLNLLRS